MPPFACGPNTVNSFIHLADVAENIALAAEKGRIGDTCDLAGRPTNQCQVFQILATLRDGLH